MSEKCLEYGRHTLFPGVSNIMSLWMTKRLYGIIGGLVGSCDDYRDYDDCHRSINNKHVKYFFNNEINSSYILSISPVATINPICLKSSNQTSVQAHWNISQWDYLQKHGTLPSSLSVYYHLTTTFYSKKQGWD